MGISGGLVIERGEVDGPSSVRASRNWWDESAKRYVAEHGAKLAQSLRWGPEGVTEQDLGLLGEVAGRQSLEVGVGAGQCSQWLHDQGACSSTIRRSYIDRPAYIGPAYIGSAYIESDERGKFFPGTAIFVASVLNLVEV